MSRSRILDKSKDKIPNMRIAEILYLKEDFSSCEDFLAELEKFKVKAQTHFDGFDKTVFIYPMYDDNKIYLEFWASRMETDDEYEDRMEEIKQEEEKDRTRAIKQIKYLAEKNNLTVSVEKNENVETA